MNKCGIPFREWVGYFCEYNVYEICCAAHMVAPTQTHTHDRIEMIWQNRKHVIISMAEIVKPKTQQNNK